MTRTRTILACLALALAAAACSSSSNSNNNAGSTGSSETPQASATTAAAAGVLVNASDALKFTPATVTVKVGETVRWHNIGTAPHTVTFTSGPSFSKPLNPGDSVSYVPTAAGTIHYKCTIHPAMTGTIVVQ